MDTDCLEEYTAMCDCPEVQGHRPRVSDADVYVSTRYPPLIYYPTQREIQDWIWRLTCEFRLMQDFYYWAATTRQKCLDMVKDRSLEQLWLQFYMWREHEKVWDHDEQRWVDERAYGLVVD